jgi:hypothetical protein
MKLLSLDQGAAHQYAEEAHWARCAVEQGQAARAEARDAVEGDLGYPDSAATESSDVEARVVQP